MFSVESELVLWKPFLCLCFCLASIREDCITLNFFPCRLFPCRHIAFCIPERLFSICELTLVLVIGYARSELNHPKSKLFSLNVSLYVHFCNFLGRAKYLVWTLQHAVVLPTLITAANVALLQRECLKVRLLLVCRSVRHSHQLKGTDRRREVDWGLLECLARLDESYPEIKFFEIYRVVLELVLRKLKIGLRSQLPSLVHQCSRLHFEGYDIQDL